MYWLVESLANVFLEILGDMMSWFVRVMTDFDFDMEFTIGQGTGYRPWQFISGQARGESELEKLFGPGATSFTWIILCLAASLALMIYVTKMMIAMGGPFTKSEDPGTLTLRFIGAEVGVASAYTIFTGLEYTFNGIYKQFKDKFMLVTEDAKGYLTSNPVTSGNETGGGTQSNLTEQQTQKITAGDRAYENILNNGNTREDAFNMLDMDLIDPNSKSGAFGSGLCMTLIEIAVFVVLLVCFAKLILEIFERYVMIGILYYFAPLAFATMVSKESNVLSSYFQMVICEFIVMCSNLFFVGVFIKAWVNILNTSEKFLFTSSEQFIVTMFLLISWLLIGQQFDQHLKSLGLSTATTGAGLGGAMMAGAGAAYGAARTGLGMVKGGAKAGYGAATGQTKWQRGKRDGAGAFSYSAKKDPAYQMSAKEGSEKLQKMDTQKGQERLAGLSDKQAAKEIGGSVNAASNGEVGKDIKNKSGYDISEAQSATYKNGEAEFRMPDGKTYKYSNENFGADTSSAQTSSVGSSGWKSHDTAEETAGKIEKFESDTKAKNPYVNNPKKDSDYGRTEINGREVAYSDSVINDDGSFTRTFREVQGEKVGATIGYSEMQVPGTTKGGNTYEREKIQKKR